ncbi:hypothetical protein J6T66_05975 [bacterium]|nr:hypothetical protein [bacterium]
MRRITTRRMVPARFSRRDIPKQTQKTLKALDDRLEELKKKLIESNKDPEIYGEINAIRYISDNLQKAFQYYISKI